MSMPNEINEDEITAFNVLVKPLLAFLYPFLVVQWLNMDWLARACIAWVRQFPLWFKIVCLLFEMALGVGLFYLTCAVVVAIVFALLRVTDPAFLLKVLRLVGSCLLFLFRLTVPLFRGMHDRCADEWTLWRLFKIHGDGKLRHYWAFRRAVKHRDESDGEEEDTRKEDDMRGNNELSYPSACALFGLPGTESFSQQEFKTRFRRYMGRYHPDKPNGSQQMAQAINEAAQIIKKRRNWA